MYELDLCALCFHDENVNIRQNERMQDKTLEKKEGRTEQNSQRLCDDFITIVENRPTIVYVHLSYVCNIGRCCWRLYCILLTTGAIIGTSFSLCFLNMSSTHAFCSLQLPIR